MSPEAGSQRGASGLGTDSGTTAPLGASDVGSGRPGEQLNSLPRSPKVSDGVDPYPRGPRDGPARANPTWTVVVLSLSGIVVALQQTILLPLLADLPGLLDTTADNVSWLVTATLLSGAIATPTISRLADMYGKRRMVLAALAISVVGSMLAALTEALPLLIVARALQGSGIALIPIGIAIMRDELPRDRVPLGVATVSATLAIGASAGLPLSGLISHRLGWHACFWLTAVVGLLLMVGTRAVVPESRVRTGGAFDVRGAVVLTLSLSAVLVALTKGGHWGWNSSATLGLAGGGLAGLAIWAPLELRTSRPLVDLRVASGRAVLTVNVASVFGGFAMYVNNLTSVLILQMPVRTGYGLGLDIVDAGLWMVPSAIAFGLVAPVSAGLTRRAGPQVALTVGAVLMAATYVGRIFTSDTLIQLVPGFVLVSMGSALVYSALPTLIMRAVPITETASANGLNVLLRSLGTSTASATTAAVTSVAVTTVGGQTFPSLAGIVLLTWLAAGAAAATAALGISMMRMREYAQEAHQSGVVLIPTSGGVDAPPRTEREGEGEVPPPTGDGSGNMAAVQGSQVGAHAVTVRGTARNVDVTSATSPTSATSVTSVTSPRGGTPVGGLVHEVPGAPRGGLIRRARDDIDRGRSWT